MITKVRFVNLSAGAILTIPMKENFLNGLAMNKEPDEEPLETWLRYIHMENALQPVGALLVFNKSDHTEELYSVHPNIYNEIENNPDLGNWVRALAE
jgi:hypothetical protein